MRYVAVARNSPGTPVKRFATVEDAASCMVRENKLKEWSLKAIDGAEMRKLNRSEQRTMESRMCSEILSKV